MPRFTWLLMALVAIALAGALVSAGSRTALANDGLVNHLCDEPDTDFTDAGYTCYNLYNKGQFPGTQQIVGQMYLLLDGTSLEMHFVVPGADYDTFNTQDPADQKVCLDDDTDPINTLGQCGGAGDAKDTVAGNAAIDCAPIDDEALYEFRVEGLTGTVTDAVSGDDHILVALPNVSNCTEISPHFNMDVGGSDLSIIGFGQPGTEPPAATIEVTKTVDTSITRECEWDVTKEVVSDGGIDIILEGGGEHTFEYDITVTAECTDTTFTIFGTITVENTSEDEDVTIDTIEDTLGFELVCDPELTATLAPGETIECTFSEDFEEAQEDGTNTATAAGTDEAGETVEGESNAMPFSFDDAEIIYVDQCVDVYDTVGDEDRVLLGQVCVEDGETEASETFDTTVTVAIEECQTAEVTNVVVLIVEDEDGNEVEIDEAEATVTVRDICFGCTPGYWKTHATVAVWGPTGYQPTQALESVFDVPDSLGYDDVTLVAALDFGGGPGIAGGARILLRAGVAALLNASHPEVSSQYPLTATEVINQVNAALASGNRGTMLALATVLDDYNNLGCPIDAHGNPID